jgi:type VI secretion system secreted protein Hcp
MAANYFLKFTPDVPGESEQTGFEGQIEILSFSWGCSNAGGFSYGGGGGVGKANLQDLSVSFLHCKASPTLMQHCASGKHLDSAVLTCLKAGGKQEKYLQFTLEDVIISSYQTGGSGDELPIESMSLNFDQVEEASFVQDDKGTTKAGPKGKWNQSKAAAG